MLQLPASAAARFSKADIAAIQRGNASATQRKTGKKAESKLAALIEEYISHSNRHAEAVARTYEISKSLPEADREWQPSALPTPPALRGILDPEVRFHSEGCLKEIIDNELKRLNAELKKRLRRKSVTVTATFNIRQVRQDMALLRKHRPGLVAAAAAEIKRKKGVHTAVGLTEARRIIHEEYEITSALIKRIDATKLRTVACAIAMLKLSSSTLTNAKQRRSDRHLHSICSFHADQANERIARALTFLEQST